MAKLVTQLTKCTAQTFSCATRINLFSHPVSRVSMHLSRSISTTRCLKVGRLFAKSHEWIVVNGNIGVVGISHHAQETLGDVVYVQLPAVELVVNTGEECGAIESVKAVSEIYSPVSGKILDINEMILQVPGLINVSCYDNGWLFKIELGNPDELKNLLSDEAYNLYLLSDQH
ncbi:glycine cleavage system H protein, mitochondrial [Megalopta genalis]|uniref:glycine cleavage system H protein, mitochondrial n=1 Tax=Megalopta genalis TaxID=115081 RepID=UPI003FD444BB